MKSIWYWQEDSILRIFWVCVCFNRVHVQSTKPIYGSMWKYRHWADRNIKCGKFNSRKIIHIFLQYFYDKSRPTGSSLTIYIASVIKFGITNIRNVCYIFIYIYIWHIQLPTHFNVNITPNGKKSKILHMQQIWLIAICNCIICLLNWTQMKTWQYPRATTTYNSF